MCSAIVVSGSLLDPLEISVQNLGVLDINVQDVVKKEAGQCV